MGGNKWVWYWMVVCLFVLLPACSGADSSTSPDADDAVETKSLPTLEATEVVEPEGLPSLDVDTVAQKGDSCQALYQDHIAAWDSRDAEDLRQLYTEDIVHFDGQPLFVGIDEVVEMAGFMYQIFPEWEMQAGDTYISLEKCLGTWINWGVFGFTQDDPAREYDLFETRGDQIFYWTLYYDQKFHSAIEEIDLVDSDFLAQFASAWSSGDTQQVVELYAEDAMLEDSLFGFSIIGQEEITAYANRLFAQSPGASWEVLEVFAESKATPPFVEEYPFSAQGGVFGINVNDPEGKQCQVRVVVVLTPNDEGILLSQVVFYNAETLIACGWAE